MNNMGITFHSCPFNLNRPANRILWEITGKCNMNCKHCMYIRDGLLTQDLSTERILELVDQIRLDGTIDEIWLSGGEPLIREDIFDIISSINKAGIRPSISTNGFLITSNLAIRLKKEGVNYVHLSIDGINSDEHDSFRRKKGAFEHVIQAADFLDNAGICVGATCIVTNININNIENIIKLALIHKIKVLSFYMIEPLGRGKTLNMAIDISLMEKLSTDFESLNNKYSSDIRLELFRATNNRNDLLSDCKCYNFLTITNDGELGGCPWLMKSDHNTVRIPLNETPFYIAREKVQKELKTLMCNRSTNLQHCQECKKNNICGKGCPAVSNSQFVDPLCKYLKNEN